MICGCCKDLGCFGYNDTIKFGILSANGLNDYLYHIWSNGTYTTINQSTPVGEELTLPFTFNENSETTIKIEFPSDYQNPNCGINFATTTDGACCFTIHGLLTTCH